MPMTAKPLTVRFWNKVVKTDTCWIWTGRKDKDGYGRIFISKSRALRVHRFSLELHTGRSADGRVVMHRCDNPACVNPDHLSLGSPGENVRDCIQKGRARFPGPTESLKGERNPSARLSEEDARRVVRMYRNGHKQSEIGEIFGVSQSAVSLIIRHKTWRHI